MCILLFSAIQLVIGEMNERDGLIRAIKSSINGNKTSHSQLEDEYTVCLLKFESYAKVLYTPLGI